MAKEGQGAPLFCVAPVLLRPGRKGPELPCSVTGCNTSLMNPLAYHASLQPWQFFITLTYGHDGIGGAVPPAPVRQKMLFAFLRQVGLGRYKDKKTGARLHRVNWHSLLWLAREEQGEKGGRHHFHILLAGLPPDRHNVTEAHVQKTIWRECGGGIADVRMYEAGLDAVSYVLKGLEQWSHEGANAYELGKFRDKGDCMPILADSCVETWVTGLRKWATGAKAPRASSGTGAAVITGRSLSVRRKAKSRTRIKETPEDLDNRIRSNWLGMHPAGASFVR